MPTSACLHPPILLATDGSSDLERARTLLRPLAQLIARPSATPFQVLTVQPRPPLTRPQLWRRPAPDAADAVRSDPLSADAAPPASDPLLASEVAHGRPAATILRYAQQIEAGLVAIETTSAPEPQALLWNRVASSVARYAASHVLLVRGDVPSSGWQRVVLVLSADQASQQAIALMRQLLPLGVRHVTLLCIQPPLNTHYWYGPFASTAASWQLTQLLLAAQQEQAQRLVEQAEAVLAVPGLEVTALIQRREPGPLICQVANQQQADVILLGSDGSRRFGTPDRATPRPMRLTATGDYVIHHAPCPVLLCRAAAAPRSLPLRFPSIVFPMRLYAPGMSGTR